MKFSERKPYGTYIAVPACKIILLCTNGTGHLCMYAVTKYMDTAKRTEKLLGGELRKCKGSTFTLLGGGGGKIRDYTMSYFRCHDELMINHVVWSETHPKESTGRVQVTRHTSSAVHILPNTLK